MRQRLQLFVVLGIFSVWFWFTHSPFRPDMIERARFSIVYGAAREATDFYTRCAVDGALPPPDQRAQVVSRFRELRDKVESSAFEDDLKFVDLQQQVSSEDEHGTVRDQAICDRLGAKGAKSQVDVFAAIAAVETFLKRGRS